MARPAPLKPPEPVRWSILAPILAIAALVVPIPAWIVEELYSRDTYPFFQQVMTSTTNLLPFALLDALLLLTAAAVIYRLVRLANAASQRGLLNAMGEGVRRVIRFAAIVTILFCWAWGFNYRRPPLEQGLRDGKVAPLDQDTLRAAVAEAASLASRLRPIVRARGDLTDAEIADALHPGMNDALKKVGRPALMTPGRPKHSVVLTPFFTAAGVSGMINPLGLESIVHTELLPFERPFVLAHEWAHLSGQGDEADASAVGWLACMLSEPPFAYSASLYLILEAGGSLPAEMRRLALSQLDSGVRADLDAIYARLRRQHPTVQRASTRVYDEYLKANRVPDGMASYGRAVALIMTPPLRDALASYDPARQMDKPLAGGRR
jgi:hypothetical protein